MLPPKVYPCQEHGEVSVPITEVILDGKVELFPEVSGRGFFDIDFRAGRLVLIAKGYIGLIPLNDRVSIHVTPRVPVDNVLYLVQRAHKAVEYLPGYERTYRVERLPSGRSEELFAATLIACLVSIERSGLMRRYVSFDVDRGLRGRVLMAPTVNRFIAKGVRFHQTRRVTELSTDIPENRVIKEMLTHVIRYFSQLPSKIARENASRAATLYQMFDSVSNIVGGREEMARQCLLSMKRIPGDFRGYERILWLCYLIATRQGVSLEAFGPAKIETMVVNLSDIFEGYVREVIRDRIAAFFPGGMVRDGNKDAVPLYVQGRDHKAKPDIYLLKAGRSPIVLDAKYKPQLSAADRYEVLAFCEALQSKLAIFVSPGEPGKPKSAFMGRTPGGIALHEISIDLGAEDILAEEGLFIERLRVIVGAEP